MSRTRLVLVTVIGLLAAHAALLLGSIRRNYVVVDEVGHVAAGLSHWQTGTFVAYRVNPPLPRMLAVLPMWAAGPVTDYHRLRDGPGRPDGGVGRDLQVANGSAYLHLV